MPKAERPSDDLPRVWFLRDFAKADGTLFANSKFRALTFEEQGIWWSLLLYSMRESAIPGWFLDRETGRELRDEEIVYAVAGGLDRIDTVRQALQSLRRADWLRFSPREGWIIPGYADKYCTTAERKKVRDADAARQRRRRAKDKEQSGIVHIREREQA